MVVSRDGAPPQRPGGGSAQPFRRAGLAAATTSALPEWEDLPVALSVVELGPELAQPVADGIAAARGRITRCVAVERRKRPAAAEEPGSGRGPVELVLRLAPRSGAVHVVGVELNTVGASPDLADCARRHLDGDAFPIAVPAPGRHRLLVTLP